MRRTTGLILLGGLILTSACAKNQEKDPVKVKNYQGILAAVDVIQIHGETAGKLEKDTIALDNLDYLLANNKKVAIEFAAYWCDDCYNFNFYFKEAAGRPEYDNIVFAYAEVDGTKGNEGFRDRFALPGVPVVMLFENGQLIEKNGRKAILFGNKGDKTRQDLQTLLKTFFGGGDS